MSSYETSDPKTVEALEKIRRILREHDLWAAVIAISAERMHWLYHFDPSWSCVSFDPRTGEVRMRAKRADFKTAEQHQRVIDLTTGAIISTRDAGAKMFKDLDSLFEVVKKGRVITHEYSDPQFAQQQQKEKEEPALPVNPCEGFIGGSADGHPEICDRCGKHYATHPKPLPADPPLPVIFHQYRDRYSGAQPAIWLDDWRRWKQHAEALRELAERLVKHNAALESLRPHWAQGYTDDGVAAQAATAALSELWQELGVSNQTDAVAALRKLKGERA